MSEAERGSIAAALRREEQESRDYRKARGIVHTPRELAMWSVARVDALLRGELGLADGLAGAQILDPAVGTGVWLEAALALVRGTGPREPRALIGLDVDARVLETARSVLAPSAREREVALDLREANTLEVAQPWTSDAVRVILGNPPWASRSLSRGAPLSDAWLLDFMRDGDGKPLAERRIGVLSDDYVRFFRWALEQARTAPRGAIVCFATNSSFLDGPVHRGMRAQLLAAFDAMEVLDLGGNALVAREAGRDENLFGVRVGAAVTIAVRNAEAVRRPAEVSYRRLRGTREQKLSALAGDAMGPVCRFVPASPAYRFVPLRGRSEKAPAVGFRLDEAFPFHREGVQTNRDALAVDIDRTRLLERLEALAQGRAELPASRHLEPTRARAVLAEALRSDADACVTQLAYRPLDTRFVCTISPVCHRPRPELARAAMRSELCLLSVRKDRGLGPFHLFGASRGLADACFLSTRSSCRTRVFPSHTPEGEQNLAVVVRRGVAERIGREPHASEVLAYALGVLGASRFREASGDTLKLDYAALPWPADARSFGTLRDAGQALARVLCEPLSADGGCENAADGDDALDTATLMLDVRARSLRSIGGARLEVPDTAWDARVGHHLLMAVALQARRRWVISDVLEVVRRATLWAAAAAAADEAYFECFGA